MRKLLLSGVATLVLTTIVYFSVGYVLYDQLTTVAGRCDKHIANRPDSFTNYSYWPEFEYAPYFMPAYEAVRIPSRKPGLMLAGWYVAAAPGAPVVVLVDGLSGCKHTQHMLVPAGMLWRNGFNVLLVDLHDTGESDFEDGRTALGNEEYLDALGAWDWLRAEQGFTPERIGMMGNSLGAATVLVAFAQEPQLAAIFLNSPFANLPQLISEEMARNNIPAFFAPAATLVPRVIAGDDLLAHSPLDAIRTADARPVFIVHSRDDPRVDFDHSEQLTAAAQEAGVDVTTWFIEGEDHVGAAATHTVEFEAKLVTFFRDALTQ